MKRNSLAVVKVLKKLYRRATILFLCKTFSSLSSCFINWVAEGDIRLFRFAWSGHDAGDLGRGVELGGSFVSEVGYARSSAIARVARREIHPDGCNYSTVTDFARFLG